MADDPSISGTVRFATGEPVPGARVEIFDQRSEAHLASTHTDTDGRYRAWPTESDGSELADDLVIRARVVDGVDETLAERLDHRSAPDVAEPLDFEVPVLDPYVPAVEVLHDVTGTIFDPDLWSVIDDAIAQVAAPATVQREQYQRVARCPRPEIFVHEDLLDITWMSLRGDPTAAAQLRSILTHFARKAPIELAAEDAASTSALQPVPEVDPSSAPPSIDPSVLGPSSTTIPRAVLEEPRGAPPQRDIIPPDRFLPLIEATHQIADDPEDLENLLLGLVEGLHGIEELHGLYNAAHRAMDTGEAGFLRGTLARLIIDCGPDDGPRPRIPRPSPREPRARPRPLPGPGPVNPRPIPIPDGLPKPCITGPDLRSRWVKARTYAIASLSPPDACAGMPVILRGQNFGKHPGRVVFSRRPERSGAHLVTATRWSDTEIEVTVPPNADAGFIGLEIFEGTRGACGRALAIYRKGNYEPFMGGSPSLALSINGTSGTFACVRPGTTSRVRWAAAPSDARVRLRVTRNGHPLVTRSNQPASGSLTWIVPKTPAPVTYKIEAEATAKCGTITEVLEVDADVEATISITDIELTQGVQTLGLADGTPDNSLPLIARKDTIVRVFVACDRSGFMNDEVEITGMLEVGGTRLTPVNGQVPTGPRTLAVPAGTKPFVTDARHKSKIVRFVTDHSLNFRIPASLASGTKTFAVDVVAEPTCRKRAKARTTGRVEWTFQPPLQVRYLRIRDNRIGGGGRTPTDADARTTILRNFDLLPSSSDGIAPARVPIIPTVNTFENGAGLFFLLRQVVDTHSGSMVEWLRSASPPSPTELKAIWVGLTFSFNRGMAEVPIPSTSCLSARYVPPGDTGGIPIRRKTAHELGHNLGFDHVNIGSPSVPCCYNHPDGGFLRDVAFDPFWNTTLGRPSNTADIMSYGSPRWLSADSWERFRLAIARR